MNMIIDLKTTCNRNSNPELTVGLANLNDSGMKFGRRNYGQIADLCKFNML